MWLLIFLVVLVVGFLIVREVLRYWVMFALAGNYVKQGRTKSAIIFYRKVLLGSTMFSGSVQREARSRLSWLMMAQGNYEEAATLIQELLAGRRTKAEEAHIRHRLAEALDGAGEHEAAEHERVCASELLDAAEESVEKLVVKASLLNTQQRYAEAYATLELALPKITNPALRAQTMVQLSLAAFESGKTEAIVRWGEEALTLQPDHTIRSLAHDLCGTGYASEGNLDEAERHRQLRLEIEQKAGDGDKIAECMARLATIKQRRGDIDGAMRLCSEARELRDFR